MGTEDMRVHSSASHSLSPWNSSSPAAFIVSHPCLQDKPNIIADVKTAGESHREKSNSSGKVKHSLLPCKLLPPKNALQQRSNQNFVTCSYRVTYSLPLSAIKQSCNLYKRMDNNHAHAIFCFLRLGIQEKPSPSFNTGINSSGGQMNCESLSLGWL